MKRILFVVLAVASLFLSPALSLFMGVAFALLLGSEFDKYTHKASSMLLKVAVVGLGFGMNLMESLKSSSEGIIFTIFSVVIVMIAGVVLGRWFKLSKKLGYLISAGTAICGGSAIASVAPVIRAKDDDISISLAVIFTLNAVAMMVFPYIGQAMQLSQTEFGMWSAIAIHDTSAVVGAAKMYGQEALQIATTVKLSRALWIIPLSLISIFIFRNDSNGDTKSKISIPYFILLFVVAMSINTYFPLGETLSNIINVGSHKILSLTLFLIGGTLSVKAVKSAGARPIVLGILLWVLISVVSLFVITQLS